MCLLFARVALMWRVCCAGAKLQLPSFCRRDSSLHGPPMKLRVANQRERQQERLNGIDAQGDARGGVPWSTLSSKMSCSLGTTALRTRVQYSVLLFLARRRHRRRSGRDGAAAGRRPCGAGRGGRPRCRREVACLPPCIAVGLVLGREDKALPQEEIATG